MNKVCSAAVLAAFAFSIVSCASLSTLSRTENGSGRYEDAIYARVDRNVERARAEAASAQTSDLVSRTRQYTATAGASRLPDTLSAKTITAPELDIKVNVIDWWWLPSSRFYGWYSPFRYNGFYSPYYAFSPYWHGMYSPSWYGPAWLDPWHGDWSFYMHAGFYDPWYGGWYGGWYDPWYSPWYGGFYGGWYGGYYGGWYAGWYDPWYGPWYGPGYHHAIGGYPGGLHGAGLSDRVWARRSDVVPGASRVQTTVSGGQGVGGRRGATVAGTVKSSGTSGMSRVSRTSAVNRAGAQTPSSNIPQSQAGTAPSRRTQGVGGQTVNMRTSASNQNRIQRTEESTTMNNNTVRNSTVRGNTNSTGAGARSSSSGSMSSGTVSRSSSSSSSSSRSSGSGGRR